MTCQQPGCTGSIQDGYCDVCGMAAATAAGAPAATPTGAPSVPAPTDGSSCTQPGCAGTVEDGYCNVCGSPAAAAASQPDPVTTSPTSARTSASRIQSAALGSRRAGTSATRRAGHGSQRMRAARLGAGLTVVPPAPSVDALKAVVDNPSVPEDKRTCSKCGSAIGRSTTGKTGRSEGFCPTCGQEFSFTPKLKAGDVVGGQYEVVGAIAHGGLGWIYLAKDRNVSNRWVVLKGLLNSGDPDALAAAIAEQQFLAQVEHPLIVEIYNFVTHEGAGYIVMEWVGGRSLKQILKQRMKDNSGAYDALPVDQALAYILEVLPAFSYLHDLGLVYCDFKPDNLIQVGDAVKLIDLGGVRRINDEDSAIFGTLGYQAPEVPQVGTSVASDIYTIGRTLVVLCMEFRGSRDGGEGRVVGQGGRHLVDARRIVVPARRRPERRQHPDRADHAAARRGDHGDRCRRHLHPAGGGRTGDRSDLRAGTGLTCRSCPSPSPSSACRRRAPRRCSGCSTNTPRWHGHRARRWAGSTSTR